MGTPGYRPYKPRSAAGAGKILPWVWVALAVAGLLGALAWAFVVQSHAVKIDKDTLCDVRGPSAVTVMLIDATDRIEPIQRTAIDNRLVGLVGALHANERLVIYEIRPDADPLKPAFSKCRPPSPDEVSDITGNKRLAKRRFEDNFKTVLERISDELLSRPPATRSPIMEAIQAASVKSLDAPDLRRGEKGFRRRLVIVSDLMQYSEAGTHYRGVPDFASYRRSPEFSKYTSDMTNVDVVVLYLRRDGATKVQGRAHLDFWDQWFTAQGARLQDAVPIGG